MCGGLKIAPQEFVMIPSFFLREGTTIRRIDERIGEEWVGGQRHLPIFGHIIIHTTQKASEII